MRRKTNTMGQGLPSAVPGGKQKGAVLRSDGMASYPKKNAGKAGKGKGGGGSFTQAGERGNGAGAGHSRTNKGKNRLGSGRQQAMRG